MPASPLAPAWLTAPDDVNALAATVWSAGVERAASGALSVAGVSATELAERFGTPLYVLDEADLRARAAGIRTAFDRETARIDTSATVYYAGKAFLSTEVARWVTEAGLNVDVCSGGELAVALAAGVEPGRIGFHGNNKSLAEIERAVGARVGVLVVDSVVEIGAGSRMPRARAGRRQRVRLR